ncbi:MAG: PH domain-containing protein [Bacteroidetes bacterium]|nr:PH domain-containing protein [Bacteroidota bacterium]
MNSPILIKLRPSPIYAFMQIFLLLMLTLVLLFIAYAYAPPIMYVCLIVLGIAAHQYLRIRAIRYQITAETIHVTTGILFKRTDTLELYRVKDYIIQQNPTEQIFRLMHLTLLTRDLSSPALTFVGIPKSDLADTLRDLVQQARKNNSNVVELN